MIIFKDMIFVSHYLTIHFLCYFCHADSKTFVVSICPHLSGKLLNTLHHKGPPLRVRNRKSCPMVDFKSFLMRNARTSDRNFDSLICDISSRYTGWLRSRIGVADILGSAIYQGQYTGYRPTLAQ